jgi:septum formation protein
VTRLVLGSTSVYRRALLDRLGVPFEVARPDVDETPLPGETADVLAARLARLKAADVAARHPGALCIGSDQVAAFDGRLLGKPGHREAAVAQLAAMSGRDVAFHTGVALAGPGGMDAAMDLTVVRFRVLSAAEIARYVDAEMPFDCAGSFKSEGLGITLFEAIETRDPSALVGLPLIATAGLLRARGLALP